MVNFAMRRATFLSILLFRSLECYSFNAFTGYTNPAFVPQQQQNGATAEPADSYYSYQQQLQSMTSGEESPYEGTFAQYQPTDENSVSQHQTAVLEPPQAAAPETRMGIPGATTPTLPMTPTTESDGIVGEKFVLGNNPKQSSGKSSIYEAAIPGEEPVIVKLSPNMEALEREARNYEHIVTEGNVQGQDLFVEVHDYLEQADPHCDQLKHQAALIMEKGEQDLKSYIEEHGPLEGRNLQEAARAVARCVEAVHTSNMVWTEIKSANFVMTRSASGRQGIAASSLSRSADLMNVKGIDLESAVPHSENPIDYSPEACPPEFAIEFLCGREPHMEMDHSFDIWSLGILLYEMATGQAYFDTGVKDNIAIAMILKNAAFAENSQKGEGVLDINKHGDIDRIEDAGLKDLIEWCLQIDPDARPTIREVLQHPFFTTSTQY